MKSSALGPGRKSIERGSTFKRKTGRRMPTIEKVAMARAQQWKEPLRGGICEAPDCDHPAEHAHHIIEKAQLKKIGADLWDPRNRLAICADCHANHHNASHRLPLPPRSHPVWGFAKDLGLEWWLLRYYEWPESRFRAS